MCVHARIQNIMFFTLIYINYKNLAVIVQPDGLENYMAAVQFNFMQLHKRRVLYKGLLHFFLKLTHKSKQYSHKEVVFFVPSTKDLPYFGKYQRYKEDSECDVKKVNTDQIPDFTLEANLMNYFMSVEINFENCDNTTFDLQEYNYYNDGNESRLKITYFE